MDELTYSLCPVCLERIPARRVTHGGDIYMEKTCPEHGDFSCALWQGEPRFERWQKPESLTPPASADVSERLGCPYDCGLCSAHEQTACCVIVDVTRRCDLGCSMCFMDAQPSGIDAPLAELAELAEKLSLRKTPYNIQLSGGEPCMREDIADAAALFCARFPYVQLNTNGMRIAQEPDLARALKRAGLACVFLNFAGTEDAIYRKINGRPLFKHKLAAIDACADAGLPVVLTMPVLAGINDGEIGAVLDFALTRLPAIRGIHFLPAARLGRNQAPEHFTLPELVRALERQSLFRIAQQDLVPLVSGSCACSFHGHFLVEGGRLTPLTSESDAAMCACKQDAVAAARKYLARRWGVEPDTLSGEALLKYAGLSSFSITAMAFMDAWNFDIERVKKCRLQAALPDGRLIPFCAYNVTNTAGERLYGW